MADTKSGRYSAHDRLPDAAQPFFSNGTGIDALVSRADAAKNASAMTSVRKKSPLMLIHEKWLSLYRIRENEAESAHDKVLTEFIACADHAAFTYGKGCRGYGLLNATAELPADTPARQVVRRHKEEAESIPAGHPAVIIKSDHEPVHPVARHPGFLPARAGVEGHASCLSEAIMLASDTMEAL